MFHPGFDFHIPELGILLWCLSPYFNDFSKHLIQTDKEPNENKQNVDHYKAKRLGQPQQGQRHGQGQQGQQQSQLYS